MRKIQIIIMLFLLVPMLHARSEQNKAGKISVNGITSDFDQESDQVLLSPDLLGKNFESDSDSRWGSLNEIISLKLTWDEQFLYIGVDGVLDGNNSILVYLDTGSGTGTADVSSLSAEKRRIRFKGMEPDFFAVSYNNTTSAAVYRVSTALSVAGTARSTFLSGVRGGVELQVAWETLYGLGTGRVSSGARLKITGCVCGGNDSTAVDSAPDTSLVLPNQWDQTATIDNYITIPLDEDLNQLPDLGVDIRNSAVIAIDTTSLRYQPLQLMNLSIRNQAFSPNHDSVNDEVSVSYYLTKDATVDVEIFNLDGDLIAPLQRGAELTSGFQSVSWDGHDRKGILQPAGLYVFNIKARASGVTVARRIGVYLLN